MRQQLLQKLYPSLELQLIRTKCNERGFYADDLILLSETMEGLKKRFLKWRSALESKGLKMNLEKTEVLVCGSEGEVIRNRIDPCGICGKRVIVNSLLCTKCDQ